MGCKQVTGDPVKFTSCRHRFIQAQLSRKRSEIGVTDLHLNRERAALVFFEGATDVLREGVQNLAEFCAAIRIDGKCML